MNEQNIGLFIQTGLNILSSEETKVPSSQIENLASFKNILRSLLQGELVIATPDRILPDGVELPKQENSKSEED